MKKIVSLMLVACLLLSYAAMATDGKVGMDIYLQDGLDFTLMQNRHTLVDDDVRNRMQQVYEEIHLTDHYSEMSVRAHAGGIGTDINCELTEMNLPFTAYDYFIYDSFELQLKEAYAEQLKNGNTIPVFFNMNIERNVHPVVLLHDEGSGWKCLQHENVQMNNGVLCVRFDQLGTVLVLVEMENKLPGSGDYNGNFTPSITGKAAPELLPVDKNNPSVIALIYNELDEMISRVPDEGYFVVTPVSRRDMAEDKEVRERLEWAYNQIMTTPRIGDIPLEGSNVSNAPVIGDSSKEEINLNGVGSAIDTVLDASGFDDLTSDDMIVRDLFDASLYGTEYVDALNDEGHYIEITFDLKVKPSDPLVILVTNDNQSWKVISWQDYEINADGSVTICLEEMGTIAVLVDSTGSVNAGVKSPKTGE